MKVGGGFSIAFSRSLTSHIRRLSTAATTTSTTSDAFPLKNVTRSNFDLTLPELTRQIRAADFVAIDLEMTGVTSAPWRESFEFDRYDVRYLKVSDSAEKFAVVQFGVCLFRWDAIKQSLVAHPHNFYIFPRQEFSASARHTSSYVRQLQLTSWLDTSLILMLAYMKRTGGAGIE